MKKIFALMAALMMVVAFGGLAFADETEKAEEPAKEASPKTQITGEVTAIDTEANTVTVKGRKGESTCEVTAGTKIKRGKEAKTLADIKVGDRVECRHVDKDGKRVCKSLKVEVAEEEEEKKD